MVCIALLMVALLSCPAAWAAGTSQIYDLSVTIPATVTSPTQSIDTVSAPAVKDSQQLVQTQTVIRDHQKVTITSIIVP